MLDDVCPDRMLARYCSNKSDARSCPERRLLMHRRACLQASCALSTMAVMSALPRFARADTGMAGTWRVFEVTTQVQILKPAGVTRVWLPVPLLEDTPYQKGLGNTWKAEGATIKAAQESKFGAAF